MIDSMRSTSASEFLICDWAWSRCEVKLFTAAIGGIVVALALLERLLGDEAGLHQFLAALEVGLGEVERALARGDFRFRGREGVLRLLHVGLRGAQLRLVFRRGDLRDDLTLRDAGALLDRDFGEPAGIFRRDVDLGRLDAAVRLDDAGGQRLAAQPRDQIADRLRVRAEERARIAAIGRADSTASRRQGPGAGAAVAATRR